MIKSISLKNFRSFEDATIEFCPGINIIIGENGNGKTNIVRSLDWVANNRPPGDGMRSNFSDDETSVTVETNDGIIVERIRSKSSNIYKLNGSDFHSFKFSPPDEIKAALNLGDDCIRFQFEGPFLLNKSAADVARYYSAIVKLDVIDRTVKAAANRLRQENAKLVAKESELKAHNEKIASFNWISKLDAMLSQMESAQAVIDLEWTRFGQLSQLIQTAKHQGNICSNLRSITAHAKKCESIFVLKEKIDDHKKKTAELNWLYKTVKDLSEETRGLSGIIRHKAEASRIINLARNITTETDSFETLSSLKEAAEQIETSIAGLKTAAKNEAVLLKALSQNNKIDADTKDYNALLDLIEAYYLIEDNIDKIKKELSQCETDLAKAMPNSCPIFDVKCSHIDKARKAK